MRQKLGRGGVEGGEKKAGRQEKRELIKKGKEEKEGGRRGEKAKLEHEGKGGGSVDGRGKEQEEEY